jgi:Putative abortive phage resistance protein AbiGi, antitoxin
MPSKREHAIEVTSTASYISETLYHFLPNNFDIFTSIIERGLLCSVGNKGKLDRFSVTLKGEGVRQFDIWQHPRVCFTDIPREHLGTHVNKYGKFGVGFSRKTILEWGGAPVWYLNNHASPDGTSDGGNAILYQLLRFSNLVDVMMSRVKLYNEKLIFGSGRQMQGQDAERYIYGAITSLYQMLSFVKEMSPHDGDTQQYLYEREWRIVAAAGDAFRNPTPEEKGQLLRQNAAWGLPPNTDDADILARFESSPMVEQFAFFQGNPGQQTVSQAIEVILVPDEEMELRVIEFIGQHAGAFRAAGPDVSIFPDDRPRAKRRP